MLIISLKTACIEKQYFATENSEKNIVMVLLANTDI